MPDETFEGWAILELMGHRRLAGYVREVEVAGAGMLRLDIPRLVSAVCTCGSSDPASASHEDHRSDCWLFAADEEEPKDIAATQFYAASALYCLTPTTEAIARQVAKAPTPVQRWEIEAARPAPTVELDFDALGERPDEHTEAEWADLESGVG